MFGRHKHTTPEPEKRLFTHITMRNGIRADTYLPMKSVIELMESTTLVFEGRHAISFENADGLRELLFIDLILGIEEREAYNRPGWMY